MNPRDKSTSGETPVADKRSAILCATRTLLANQGFHGFSIKQVADTAGVAAGTVYLYFKDREDLIRQLYGEVVSLVAKHVFNGLDRSRPLHDQFQLICMNYWEFCQQNPDVLMCKAQFDQLPTDALLQQKTNSDQEFQPFFELFEQGRSQGVIKPFSNEVLISLALEPLSALAVRQHLGLFQLSSNEVEGVLGACWDVVSIPGSA